jgi:hypothetical protein
MVLMRVAVVPVFVAILKLIDAVTPTAFFTAEVRISEPSDIRPIMAGNLTSCSMWMAAGLESYRIMDTSAEEGRILAVLVNDFKEQFTGSDALDGADAVASVILSAGQGSPSILTQVVDSIRDPKLEHTADDPEVNAEKARPVIEMTLMDADACSDPTVNENVASTLVELKINEDNENDDDNNLATTVTNNTIDEPISLAPPASEN